ncbi:MAG: glycine dehydrogenase subunit 2 [Epsilonproteobacteria bacterium]|nr:glycine dehydrogenase subunit 2 [Campylobacterota bacterium]
MKSLFELSREGRRGVRLPKFDVKKADLDKKFKRDSDAKLPEVSELDTVRHFTRLSELNFSIDKNFYPLGSCTMKYNPKIEEKVASLEGFLYSHPAHILNNNIESIQGSLESIYKTQKLLCEITGMDDFTLSPQAGAHGEMTGIMLIDAYHKEKGNKKRFVIVPDSSHGTNPATASMVGYEVITIKSDENGVMNMEEFKKAMSDEVAAVMLTVPNTLGIFNPYIKEICDIAHSYDALMYYDGANLNAILGVVRPGDLGFDVMHINLHKTFATPHGGGGPGCGPVGVKEYLKPFMPKPQVEFKDGKYALKDAGEKTIGRVSFYFGNYLVAIKALTYMLILGKEGLENVSKKAVLNANYIRVKLKDFYDLPYDRTCMHEVVFSAKSLQKEYGVKALDVAKYLLDFGLHAPTVYFPLIVKEAMMIEPTETESKESIDEFCDKMIEAAKLAKTNPEALKEAPKNLPISRPDETKAARELDICDK